jgi:hypothetical protein
MPPDAIAYPPGKRIEHDVMRFDGKANLMTEP